MAHFYTPSELLFESVIKKYLADEAQMLASMLDSENDAAKFSKWKSDTATPVEVVSYSGLPIAKSINSNIRQGILQIRPKMCYDNSFWTASAIKDVKYCEGIAHKHIPIDHAWNSYKGSAFDLTGEIALKSYAAFDEHAMLIELSSEETMEMASTLKHSGPYALAYFYKHVLKKWDRKTIAALKRIA
jgi:hypothetical protein